MKVKTLLIDNYDSFSYNLYQLIAEVNDEPPFLVKNNAATWEEVAQLPFDNIVISPGPGRPEVDQDFGICKQAILQSNVPILGVCLGHQGICHLFGGEIDYAEEVMHGRASDVHHKNIGPFAGIPSPFSVIRYHSLHAPVLSEELEAIAWTTDNILMGVVHKTKPIWGVQFHPESISTEYGEQILENFLRLTENYQQQQASNAASRSINLDLSAAYHLDSVPKATKSRGPQRQGPIIHGQPFKVYYRRLPLELNAEQVFLNLYADSNPAFWLDSALVRGFSRFSYMGNAMGPHAEFVSYDVSTKTVTVTHHGEITEHNESIFDYLDRTLRERYVPIDGLPFDFNLGYAGYLGYELKADCDGDLAHKADTADAQFVFADRLVVFDHEERVIYLACLDDVEHESRAKEWLNQMWDHLHNLKPVQPWQENAEPQDVKQTLRLSPEQYRERILESQRLIAHGETYEVCLTNMITQHVTIDPLNTYRSLRASNPAPYATYLQFPEVTVLSSSPERFITVDPNGVVESKPIKGTRRRGSTATEDEELYQDLRSNEKDNSENLMIVDLLRNDIGSVCSVGSVHVSSLFAVETYATVHQLVSTIRGKLRRGISSVQCVQAAFPGGSMTGAPKKRTMEIIDRLEGGPRGIYSGSIGFFGLSGSTDLSIVIRTIVCTQKDVTVGVGGAIVALSDPEAEIDEMILKSKALVHALSKTALPELVGSKSR
jgi:para-aminobenzoate synthetase